MKYELLIHRNSSLGETPVYDSENELLYWSELIDGNVCIYDFKTEENSVVGFGEKIGTIVLSNKKNKAIIALESGIYSLDLKTYEKTFLVHPETIETNRYNDGKCDAKGRLWVSSLTANLDDGLEYQKGVASLYCIDTDLSVTKKMSGADVFNGIAWSPDNTKMYVAETIKNVIMVFNYNLETGDISLIKEVKVSKDIGCPDGVCVDKEGMIWVAMLDGYCVTRWDMDKGEMIEKVDIPCGNVTCPSFGGADFGDLLVTTSARNVSQEKFTKYPKSGCVFRLKPNVGGLELYKANI